MLQGISLFVIKTGSTTGTTGAQVNEENLIIEK